jgi:Ca2+-binding RTX toxin-like protein
VRRITIMLASMALMVGVVASVAWAENIECEESTQENPCLGTNQDDTITVIFPLQDNFIDGLGGNDIIFGGEGDDFLYGGTGNDEVNCGSGNDSCFGLGGNDIVSGEEGNDTLSGGSGDDEVNCGSGNDDCLGAAGDDELRGGGGRDLLGTDNGNDTVLAGAGNDDINVAGDQQFGFQDEAFCGPGNKDFVAADPNDLVFFPTTCELPE